MYNALAKDDSSSLRKSLNVAFAMILPSGIVRISNFNRVLKVSEGIAL